VIYSAAIRCILVKMRAALNNSVEFSNQNLLNLHESRNSVTQLTHNTLVYKTNFKIKKLMKYLIY